MKVQTAILTLCAIVIVCGIAFDVGRDALRQQSSDDVLTVTQTAHTNCVGINLLSCNVVQVAAQKSEMSLFAACVLAVTIGGAILWLSARDEARHA